MAAFVCNPNAGWQRQADSREGNCKPQFTEGPCLRRIRQTAIEKDT